MKTVQIAGFTEPNKYLGTDSLGNLVLKDGGGGGGGTDIVSLQGYMTSSATLYPNNPPVSGQMGVGSGALGAIQKGNAWWVKEADTIIDGKKVKIGTLLIALANNPDDTGWLLQEDLEANFELLSNKSNNLVGDQTSTIKYPTVKTVFDYIQGVVSTISAALGFKADITYVDSTFVPNTRELTINGTTYDLSANRTWTIDVMSTICPNIVTVDNTPYYTASYGDSVYVDTDAVADNCTITLPATHVYGGLVYVKNMAQPSTYTVSVGSYVLTDGEWLLLRKGKFNAWEIIASSITDTPTNGNTDHAISSGGVFSALAGKEPAIASGTTSQYWRGDKTWQTFPTATVPNLDEVTDVGNTTTNDITVGSVTASNTTVSTLPFIDSAKKLISATGAFLGTWFQTLTAKSTPVDADTIVVNDSTASFESKKTTLLQLWTNYLLAKVQALGYLVGSGLTNNRVTKWNGSTLINSYIEDDSVTVFTRPYPTVTSQPSGGGSPSAAGGLRWFDNNTNTSDLYIYKKYAVGGNAAGWYRLIDAQNPTFPTLTVSSAEIYTNYISGFAGWTSLSTLYSGKTASIMPSKFIGDTSPGNVFSAKGIMMYDGAPNYSFLKHYDALEWKWLGATNNSYIADYMGMAIGNSVARGDSSIGFTSNAKYLVKMFAGLNVNPSITLTAIVTVNGYNVTNIKMLQESSNTAQLNLTISANKALITAPNTCDYFVKKLTSLYGGVAPTYEEKMFFSSDIEEFRWEGAKGLSLGSATINARSQLHLQSTSKGFLPNVLTTAQRDAVSWVAGDAGMIIYNSTTNKHQGWNGTTWNDMY